MLHLRPLRDGDVAWLDGWFAPVAAAVGYRDLDSSRPEGRARVIVRDGADVGLVVYRLRIPREDTAIVEIVATSQELARRGAGMGSVPLIEDELRGEGVRVIYAPAPSVHGIAVYFWIRLGYRPIMRPGWPCERAGVAWLMREL